MELLRVGGELIGLGMGTVFLTLGLLALLIVALGALLSRRRSSSSENEPERPVEESADVPPALTPAKVAAIIAALRDHLGDRAIRIRRIDHRGEVWFRAGLGELVSAKPGRHAEGEYEKIPGQGRRSGL